MLFSADFESLKGLLYAKILKEAWIMKKSSMLDVGCWTTGKGLFDPLYSLSDKWATYNEY